MPAQPSQRNLPIDWSTHTCDINAEPLHRYPKGGYHPIQFGGLSEQWQVQDSTQVRLGRILDLPAARDTKSRFLR